MHTVQITHHDWRTDERAITHPWGVAVDGRETGVRAASIGEAGDAVRQIAAECADAEVPVEMIFSPWPVRG